MSTSHPPVTLTRTLRIAATPLATGAPGANGLVGGQAPWGIAAIGDLEIAVRGQPSASGYLIDITVLDAAMRSAAAARFSAAIRTEAHSGGATDPVALLCDCARDAAPMVAPAQLVSLTYRPCPFRSITIETMTDNHGSIGGISAMPNAVLCETFEFAASHRLHVPELSDEENRRLFGKCNNPNGHGHNYRIEVAAEIPTDLQPGAPCLGFATLQQVVQREIMERFDHKHLNLDCAEFRTLNPSVENIARVCHGLLDAPIRTHGARLRFVRVWETDKTSCRYPA